MRKSIHTLLSFFLILCLSLPCISCSKTKTSQAEAFDTFCDILFCQEVSGNALTLRYCLKNPSDFGIEQADSPLGHLLSANQEEELQSLENRLAEFQPENLRRDQQFTYDCLKATLSNLKKTQPFTYYKEYLSAKGGEQVELFILISELPLHSLSEVEIYFQLLEALPAYFDELTSFEKEKASRGLFMSDEQLSDTLQSMEQMKELLKNDFLSNALLSRLDQIADLPLEDKNAYRDRVDELISTLVLPAYEKLSRELSSLKGSGKNNLGLCYLPKGREYYEALLQSLLRQDLQVPALFDSIEAFLQSDLGYCSALFSKDTSLLQKCENLTLPFTDEHAIMEHLLTEMEQDFPKACSDSYTIAFANPVLKDYLAPAFYLTAPYDDPSSNNIFINSASNSSDIYYFTTLAHEGYPGHLYQTTMSYHYEIPWLRLLLGSSAFTEGWATYVELYSFRYAGLLENTSDFLSYNRSALLGLYALSDLGIHYYGWTEEDLFQLWKDYGITSKAVLHEISQLIIGNPGNYLKYYGGYMEIRKLKEKAKEACGASFRDYDFHRALLRMGPAPFDIIEKYFDDYFSKSI